MENQLEEVIRELERKKKNSANSKTLTAKLESQ